MPELPTVLLRRDQAHGPLRRRTARAAGPSSLSSPSLKSGRPLGSLQSGRPLLRRLLDQLDRLDLIEHATRLGLAMLLTGGFAGSLDAVRRPLP